MNLWAGSALVPELFHSSFFFSFWQESRENERQGKSTCNPYDTYFMIYRGEFAAPQKSTTPAPCWALSQSAKPWRKIKKRTRTVNRSASKNWYSKKRRNKPKRKRRSSGKTALVLLASGSASSSFDFSLSTWLEPEEIVSCKQICRELGCQNDAEYSVHNGYVGQA